MVHSRQQCGNLYRIFDHYCRGAEGERQHSGVLQEWTGGPGPLFWTSRFWVLACTCGVVLGPLVAQKHLDALRYTSGISMALAALFLVILLVVFLIKLALGLIQFPRLLPNVSSPKAILQLCGIVPVMCNAFICHFNVHPIWVELKDRSESSMLAISRSSMTACTIIYLGAALCGYLLFGNDIAPDVLANFDKDLGISGSHILNDVVRVGYAVHVMLVFPLVNFALRQALDALLFPNAKPLIEDTRRFAFLTILLMGTIFLGAVLVPNIWVAFQFTGATSAVAIGFMFPALVTLRGDTAIGGTLVRPERFLAILMLVLAIIVSTAGVSSNVIAALQP
eukprot:TRINITY_DN19051_c0_g1_i2.p1 TRINITY_DN19051_c0_g1~~TRINITY_DN19051_c0_g1_i2.p1  ORF type:complete len:337 (-),score=34.39 TRINITY_DN19051_c0_g1_i2:656-1666(-)